MDVWGYHKLTCHFWGDVTTRHNQLKDCIDDFCGHKACFPHKSGISTKDQSRPLVPDCYHTQMNLTLMLSICKFAIFEMGEGAKHTRNDEACTLTG